MRSRARASLWAALVFVVGCVEDAPETTHVAWDDEACAATQPGRACLTFRFTMTSGVREEAPVLQGQLRWALYASGDVDLFGPGDNRPLYEGVLDEEADFSESDAVYRTHLANVPAKDYQLLSLLDVDRSGDGGDDEPVTFPSDPFPVPADELTEVQVVFDYVL
jgi:hypothetical protein